MYTNIATRVIHDPPEGKALILAVDGNEDNLLLMSHLLEYSTSCVLLTASSGSQALSMAKNYLPDLILLELDLPDMDGMEIVRELKENGKTNKIPLIAVTSLAAKQDKEDIIKAGCDRYLSKPYLLEDLEKIVSFYTSNL